MASPSERCLHSTHKARVPDGPLARAPAIERLRWMPLPLRQIPHTAESSQRPRLATNLHMLWYDAVELFVTGSARLLAAPHFCRFARPSSSVAFSAHWPPAGASVE